MSLIGTVARSVRNAAPVQYASSNASGLFGSSLQRGSRSAHLEAFGSVGTLFAVVSAIAQGTAKQEWWMDRVGRTNRVYGPVAPVRRELLRHPALDLWTNPNPWHSRAEFVEGATQHLMLTGETAWVLVTDPRVPALPLEMWLVRPDRITPIPHSRDFLAGYAYHGPDGETVPLDVDQVIHVKLPNPLDPYRGMGPVQALLANLDSVRYSAEWNRRFFLNDATPSGVIEMGDEYRNEADFQRLKRRWYDNHHGIGNAHRVAFLERAKWVPTAYSPRDMQFVALLNVSRDLIREAFRVHKALLGQSDDVNRANAEAADYQLANWVIEPTLSRYAGALNNRLLPRYGTPVTAQLCYASPVSEDSASADAHMAAQAGAYKTYVEAGVHPEDAAMTVGLPPMRHTEPAEPAEPEQEAIPA